MGEAGSARQSSTDAASEPNRKWRLILRSDTATGRAGGSSSGRTERNRSSQLIFTERATASTTARAATEAERRQEGSTELVQSDRIGVDPREAES